MIKTEKNSKIIPKTPLKPGNENDQNFQGGGGVFSKIFRPGGGILPEVSNFDRKARF